MVYRLVKKKSMLIKYQELKLSGEGELLFTTGAVVEKNEKMVCFGNKLAVINASDEEKKEK